jgi:hypothetical protein
VGHDNLGIALGTECSTFQHGQSIKQTTLIHV